MKYIEFVNGLIRKEVLNAKGIVLFGQNITAGSCLSGLTKELTVTGRSRIMNTQNSENTLTGIGFGLMISGVSSIFFMKQLDFLLLGMDHLVNTYNFVRLGRPQASFTIVCVVVDIGYQGMQSSFNNLEDICSLARVPGYTITNQHDARQVIGSKLICPGFRIIAVSQRLFKEAIIEFNNTVYAEKDCQLFQYTKGRDATIVCFNFSLPKGAALYDRLKHHGYNAALFGVNSAGQTKWNRIINHVRHSRRLVLIDDSKCQNSASQQLAAEAFRSCRIEKYISLKRQFSNTWYRPNPENLTIDYEAVAKKLMTSGSQRQRMP